MPEAIYEHLLGLIDGATSLMLAIDRSDEKLLKDTAAMIKPLGDYYSTGPVSLTALWGYAVTGLISYGLIRYGAYRQAHPPKKEEDVTAVVDDQPIGGGE